MKTRRISFDVDKAKAGAKVVTRCGFTVRISDFDVKNKEGYTILGIININGNEIPYGFRKTGCRFEKKESDYDLFIEEEVE